MSDKTLSNGMICFGAGLCASSLSSFLGHFSVLGDSTDFGAGFFDGLAVVAFAVAIFILVRNRKTV
jgi:hypothetical protein